MRIIGGLIAGALGAAGAAQGQVAPETPPAADEIIVTGEKAGRTLMETTTSVAITTPTRMTQENILTVQDIYNRTANVAETFGSAGFTIRGINNTGVSSGGNADTATVYIDGAPIPSDALFGGPTDIWDIAQVEVLRGPQSTIQGLNALAGAVVITTRDPATDAWHGDGRVLWTDQTERTFSAAAGGPIVEDQLGVRIAVERRADDGIIRNVTIGGHDDRLRSLQLRGKVKWTPTALPGLVAVATYNRGRRKGGYLFEYSRTDVPDFYDHRISTANRRSFGDIATDIAALNLSYPLGDRIKLTSVTSYNRLRQRATQDGDGTAEDSSVIDNRTRARTWTQEVRLNYDGPRLNLLLGGWYYHRTLGLVARNRVNIPTPVETIAGLLQAGGFPEGAANTIADNYAAALPIIPVAYDADLPQRVETAAIFGDGRFALTDRLSLLGGFRYDHERNRFAAETLASFAGAFPDPASFAPPGTALNAAITAINAGVGGLVSQAAAPFAANSRSFDAFLPKAGVSMAWTPRLVTAFVAQRGYRSGGSSQNPARASLIAYDPEYTWNYEGSLRATTLGGKVSLNANLFYTQWRKQQVTVNFGQNVFDYNTVNAGKSHLWGFEVEAAHSVSKAFDWYASLGHVETRFDDFSLPAGATADVDLAGSQFPYAPRWTVAAGANLRFGGGFVANANVNWRSRVFTDVGVDQAQGRVGGRAVVNTKLGYGTPHWGAYLYVRNLLDKQYAQFRSNFDGRAILGDPRTIGGEVQLHF